jgi:site-specific DNA-methyltransferase (adenine-specific)
VIPNYEGQGVTLWHGDCLDVLATLPSCSVDAVATDPPYSLGFMGREWDTHRSSVAFQQWCEQWAAQCLRVLKPGGHLLAFGGSRTHHRLTSGVEDAGFEIRDTITWHFASGFPKSLDVSKAIDRAAGVERTEVIGTRGLARWKDGARAGDAMKDDGGIRQDFDKVNTLYGAVTDAARQWAGWGTALKPATEFIVVARKPLAGTVAANVQAWGTGALNIDVARIGDEHITVNGYRNASPSWTGSGMLAGDVEREPTTHAGRWPANVIFDETQAAHLDEQSGERGGGTGQSTRGGGDSGDWNPTDRAESAGQTIRGDGRPIGYGDTGGASRFFFVAKADASERPSYRRLDCECEGPQPETIPQTRNLGDTCPVCGAGTRRVSHPTVKPLDLMRQLARLVTPPGGTVLEPFPGSGTTVEACLLEGFRVIAIEKGGEYVPLILARIHRQRDPVQAIKIAGEDLGLFDFGTEETA